MKVFVCSGARQESQANAQVRRSITDGWADLVGEENVVSANVISASAVIDDFKPDVVMGIGSYLPETTYFTEIVKKAHNVDAVAVFWATEDPYEQDAHYRIARDFDFVFSCDRWGVNFYDHPRVRHLPLAGCRKSHYVPFDVNRERPIDVMFCGVAFSSRKEVVSDLLPVLAGLRVQFVGPGWGEFGVGFSDRRIEKDELIQLYASSKIVLNLGRSLHFENKRYMISPSTPGPRTFEAALAGTVQCFHEDTFEWRRYFSKDELCAFSSPLEMKEILNRLLPDSGARAAIAIAAQKRALAEHTYTHRAQAVITILKEEGLL